MKKIEITQWCPIDKCLAIPYPAKVGNVQHVFCCQKGFEKSLEDFSKYIEEQDKFLKGNQN